MDRTTTVILNPCGIDGCTGINKWEIPFTGTIYQAMLRNADMATLVQLDGKAAWCPVCDKGARIMLPHNYEVITQ